MAEQGGGWDQRRPDDACGLLCLSSGPTVLAMAHENGLITLCIALDEAQPVWASAPAPLSAAIHEIIDLNVPLLEDQETRCATSLLALTAHPQRPSVLYATHCAGAHQLRVNGLGQLRGWMRRPERDDSDPPALGQSDVQEVWQTMPLPSSKPAPMYGVAVLSDAFSADVAVGYTADAQLVVACELWTGGWPAEGGAGLLDEEEPWPGEGASDDSALDARSEILAKGASADAQPGRLVGSDALSLSAGGTEAVEYLLAAIERLRAGRLSSLYTAAAELRSCIERCEQRREVQQAELAELRVSMVSVSRAQDLTLARFDATVKQQQALSRRIRRILRILTELQPVLT